jgi:hypothetical protein
LYVLQQSQAFRGSRQRQGLVLGGVGCGWWDLAVGLLLWRVELSRLHAIQEEPGECLIDLCFDLCPAALQHSCPRSAFVKFVPVSRSLY